MAKDDDAWLVHANTLIRDRDPRGELIMLQHRLETVEDHELVAAEAKLRATIGPAGDHTWRRGYLDVAVLRAATPDMLRALLDHPSAAHLRALEVSTGFSSAPAVVLALAETTHPGLRELTLLQDSPRTHDTRDPAHSVARGGLEHHAGDALWAALPNLTKLTIRGFSLFHCLALPHLEELVIRHSEPFCDGGRWDVPELQAIRWETPSLPLSTDVFAALWRNPLPALQHLDLSACDAAGYLDQDTADEDERYELETADGSFDVLGWALRRRAEFAKLAAQLEDLILPVDDLRGRDEIAAWLR
jgi:hypothetical protein